MRLGQPNFFLPFDRRGVNPFTDRFEVTLLAEGTVRGTGGLDVVDDDEIAAGVAAAERRFGRIDVLVNNAGYGYQSSIEEGVPEEIRAGASL